MVPFKIFLCDFIGLYSYQSRQAGINFKAEAGRILESRRAILWNKTGRNAPRYLSTDSHRHSPHEPSYRPFPTEYRTGIRRKSPCNFPFISIMLISIQEMFERILYIWAMRHPASGYVQGINDLVTPFFVVFLQDLIPTGRNN